MIIIFPAFHNKTQQVINYSKNFIKKTRQLSYHNAEKAEIASSNKIKTKK